MVKIGQILNLGRTSAVESMPFETNKISWAISVITSQTVVKSEIINGNISHSF